MRGVSMVVGLVAAIVISPASPAYGDHEPVDCYAELSPNTATAGSTGVSFSVRVYNGADLPASAPVNQINRIRINPVGFVDVKSFSTPESWMGYEQEDTVLYRGGPLNFGDSETFAFVGDVYPSQGTRQWDIRASRDDGTTYHGCEPAYPGALTFTAVAP